jgi:holo-[acyl-carrier protein] synthase
MGVGIDLVEIARIEESLARRPGLADRVFTAREQEYAAGKGRPGQHLAARWAAKEAVAKALEMPADWAMREVEVVCDEHGVPRITLHGAVARYAERLGVVRVAVSLTHAKDMAGAVAMTERGP